MDFETKNIRVEVSAELYDYLSEVQQEMREADGRKTSLAQILLNFCCIGIEYNRQRKQNNVQNNSDSDQNTSGLGTENEQNGENSPDSVQNNQHSDQNIIQNSVFQEQMEIIKLKEQEIVRRLKEIIEYEKQLQEKERTFMFHETQLKIQQIKQDDLEARLEHKQSEVERYEQRADEYKKELTEKNKDISSLKKRLFDYERKTMWLLDNIDRKTETNNSLFDDIMKFGTPVLCAIGYFILNKKINDIKDLSPLQKEIAGIFNNLKPEDKEQITALLKKNIKDK